MHSHPSGSTSVWLGAEGLSSGDMQLPYHNQAYQATKWHEHTTVRPGRRRRSSGSWASTRAYTLTRVALPLVGCGGLLEWKQTRYQKSYLNTTVMLELPLCDEPDSSDSTLYCICVRSHVRVTVSALRLVAPPRNRRVEAQSRRLQPLARAAPVVWVGGPAPALPAQHLRLRVAASAREEALRLDGAAWW
jgi:hypothetical protein